MRGVCQGCPVPAVPDERHRSLLAELRDVLHDDPFVVLDVDPATIERVVSAPGEAAAWLSAHPVRGVRWLTALALDPDSRTDIAAAVGAAVRLAGLVAEELGPVSGITVSRGGLELLPEPLRPVRHWEWDYWFTRREPDPHEARSAYGDDLEVVDLAPDDPRLGPLLDLASPDAPLRPGDARVTRWAGVEDPEGGLPDTGGLAALLAVTTHRSGAAHLNDVATHPQRRGRRIARALCGRVTTDALRAGSPAVTLGMYAENDAARRVYDALGFTCVRGQSSGPLARD